jgi:ATP synthase protein I
MAEPTPPPEPSHRLREQLARRAARREKAQREGPGSLWLSLGMMGLVGWSVAVPTLAGVGLGWWLDSRWPNGHFSWTLTLLLIGLAVGCFNAWHWVRREGGRR